MNNFGGYSMVSPGDMAQFFGFTREEVQVLAARHQMDFDELEKWYAGYQIGPQPSMLNPNWVMTAIGNEWCDSYWVKTGAVDSVATYIDMNYEGLRADMVSMLAVERRYVNPTGLKSDLSQIRNGDDVLTVLIHLGYLSYDGRTKECFVPNMEV